jgi:P-type conjugative transfer protein TrbG
MTFLRGNSVLKAPLAFAAAGALVLATQAAAEAPTAPASSTLDQAAQTIAAGAAPGRIKEAGVVRVPFGYERPEIVCAPLRVCAVLLEPGETPHTTLVGDSVRWEIVAEAGTGLVAVRPKICDIRTNALVVTDRRVYDLALASAPCPKGPEAPEGEVSTLLGFYYPQDLVHKWASQTSPAPTRAPSVEALHFGYRVEPAKKGVRPLRVYDDGTETYLYLGKLRGGQDYPVAYEVGGDGKAGPVDQRTAGNVLVVGKVSNKLILVSGPGDADRTTILRVDDDGEARP